MIPNLILWYFLLVQNLQIVVIRFLHFIINFGQHSPGCRGQVPLTQCTHSFQSLWHLSSYLGQFCKLQNKTIHFDQGNTLKYLISTIVLLK